MGNEPLLLIRVTHQLVHPVADQVDGRLVTGDGQPLHHGEQLDVVEAVALLLEVDERREQVVARRYTGASLRIRR